MDSKKSSQTQGARFGRRPSPTPAKPVSGGATGASTPSGVAGRVPLSTPLQPVDVKAMASANTFRILSIDGGGARGMIPAVILEELERRSGKRVSEMFHRVCGTSTGSILACGLTVPRVVGEPTPKLRAREIVEIYRSLGQEIFSRGSFNETVLEPMAEIEAIGGHDAAWYITHIDQTVNAVNSAVEVWQRLTAPLHNVYKLAYVLHEHLGDVKLKEALTELFVYAYDIGSRTLEVLGSQESTIPGGRNYAGFRMYQAATASSAAVPFFAPYPVYRNPNTPTVSTVPHFNTQLYLDPGGSGDTYDLIDGGNAALGNPALFAHLEETENSTGRPRFVLSLGTGHYSEPVPPASAGWGFVQWLGEGGELLNNLFDGSADATDMALRQMLDKDLTYFRWQPPIPESLAFLDEGSVEDMNALEDVAQTFIADHDEEIDQVVEIIKQPKFARVSV